MRSIIEQLKHGTKEILTEDYDVHQSPPLTEFGLDEIEIEEIDEVTDYITPKGALINSLEGNSKAAYLTTHNLSREHTLKLLNDQNFIGIDGSLARVFRDNISLIYIRVGMGSFCQGLKIDEYAILDEKLQLVAFDKKTVDTNYLENIRTGLTNTAANGITVRFKNRDRTNRKNFEGAASTFQSVNEIKAIPKVVDRYRDFDYLLVDGPLYPITQVTPAYQSIEYAVNKGIIPVAVTKRIIDQSWLEFINSHFPGIYDNFDHDAAFLSSYLNRGQRTPIFLHVRPQERHLDEKYRRICSYMYQNDGRIVRIETIQEYRELMPEIMDYMYGLSRLALGDIPLPVKKAHDRASVKAIEKQRIEAEYDLILKKSKIPIINSQGL